MKLSKVEQETIIIFNEQDDIATIDTCNKAWKNKLSKISSVDSSVALIREDNYSQVYKLPKKWVKINRPRQLSEAEREILAARARENFGKGT